MVKSMFAAVAGLRVHQSRMDVISNNIANVNTWGYKSRSANFQDAMYQNVVNSTAGNAERGTGGVNSSQLGYGVNMGSISTNFATGSRGFTGWGMDCMIDGPGFFIVGGMVDPAVGVPTDQIGENGLSLSRVGMFKWDSEGYLVDDMGNYAYGFSATTDPATGTVTYDTTKLVPIQIPIDPSTLDPNDPTVVGKRYEINQTTFGTDGSIVGTNSDGEAIVLGKLAVASVANPSGLEQQSGYLYKIGANAGDVTAMETTAATGMILSNYLEMSNVDLATDISTMITTQRGYQANSKIITVTDEMLEQLVNMKR